MGLPWSGKIQFVRIVNQHGVVSVQRFYIYAERGLAHKRVSIWIHQGKLHIEEPLSCEPVSLFLSRAFVLFPTSREMC